MIVADIAYTEDEVQPQFAGAAGESLTLSPEASAALAKADPTFSGEVAPTGMADAEPPTHTSAPPRIAPDDEAQPKPAALEAQRELPVAGILAACVVVAIGVAIALLI